jgi:hypothetical protein
MRDVWLAFLVFACLLASACSGSAGDSSLAASESLPATSTTTRTAASSSVRTSALDPAVVVTPSIGLGPVERVTVSGTGYPAERNLVVLLCRSQVATSRSQDDCDGTSSVAVMADDAGSFEIEFEARRYLTIEFREFDCGEPKSCGIVAAAVPDATISAGVALAFDPSAELLTPVLSVETRFDGVEIWATIEGSQFVPGSTVELIQCVSDVSSICDANGALYLVADESGSIKTSMILARAFQEDDGTVIDCLDLPERCEITTGPFDQVNRVTAAPLNIQP